MKFKRKIQKLIGGTYLFEAVYKVRRWIGAWFRPFALTDEGILGGIDLEGVKKIAAIHGIPNPGSQPEKYLEIDHWIGVNLRRVLSLGLDLKPRRRILDLGCGTGYFLHICRRLGHDVLGLDWPGCPVWYADLMKVLEVPRGVWWIKPFEPLPDLGGRFDVVTAFMICFNGHLSEGLWKKEEWAFFLDDLWTRLNPGAIVWLQLNPEAGEQYYTPELRQFFEERGALVDRNRVVWGMSRTAYEALAN